MSTTKNNGQKKANENNKSNKSNNAQSVSFIERADNVLKAVGAELREANKEYYSISGVLKDIQRTALLNKGYKKVFEALGVDVTKKLDAKTFFEALHSGVSSTDKKGNTYFGIWGYKTEKDEAGNVIKKERVLRKVTSWTPTKVFKIISQSNELKKESK